MTQAQKDDLKYLLAFGCMLVAASFIVGVFDGLDRAIDARIARDRLSVYCQQPGHNETLCHGLKEEATQ